MKKSIFITLLLLHLIYTLSYGQQNPFDLKFRLDWDSIYIPHEEEVQDTPVEISAEDSSYQLAPEEDTLKTNEGILPAINDSLEEAQDLLVENSVHPQQSLQDTIERYRQQEKEERFINLPPVLQQKRTLIFATFLILLIMLTLVITINRSVIDHILRAFLNDNFLNLLYREQRGKINIQYLFLYFFFIANLGFFIFLSMDYWFDVRPETSLLICILLVGCIYLVRYITLNLLSKIFPVAKEANQFNFTIVIFNILLGLILLPINLFLAFAPSKLSLISYYIGIVLLLLFYLFRQMRGLFISVRFLNSSKYHFFAYLCTVEIAPILVGIKLYEMYIS